MALVVLVATGVPSCGAKTGLRESVRRSDLVSITYLKASNTSSLGLEFGLQIGVSAVGPTIVVGAVADRSRSRQIDGDQTADVENSAAGAAYVFGESSGAWRQEHYVKSWSTVIQQAFAADIALSADGSTLASAAPGDPSLAAGVNGDPFDYDPMLSIGHPAVGAVFVFRRTATSWAPDAFLKPSNPHADDPAYGGYYGTAVALSADGSTLAVGAAGDPSGATGVDGDSADVSAPFAGAVFVYRRRDGVWRQEAYIKASTVHADDGFGTAVALSADGATLAVGAAGEGSSAQGVGGDATDTGAPIAGAAYVFERSADSWAQAAYIKASNTGAGDRFGIDVRLSADGATLAVGAFGEGSRATGVGGDESDDSAHHAGAVYVFAHQAGTWVQEAYIKATNTDARDVFGARVALTPDGARLFVGAPGEQSAATGIDGDQGDNSIPRGMGNPDSSAGAVYEYRLIDGAWTPWAYIKASNTVQQRHDVPGDTPSAQAGFGAAVATDGVRLVVGAFAEDSCARGVDGDQHNHDCSGAGAVYVYEPLP